MVLPAPHRFRYPPKAVLFDLDGTLVDSREDVLGAFRAAFDGLEILAPPDEELIALIGHRLEECFKPFVGGEPERVERAVALFRRHYKKHYKDTTRPYPGITKAIRDLAACHVLGIATMKRGDFARDLVRACGWLGIFQRVIGAEEGYPAKPDPTALQALCRAFDIRPDEAVYVGDTELDAQMARAAKIPFFFAAYGYGGLREGKDGMALAEVQDPRDLSATLRASWERPQGKR